MEMEPPRGGLDYCLLQTTPKIQSSDPIYFPKYHNGIQEATSSRPTQHCHEEGQRRPSS